MIEQFFGPLKYLENTEAVVSNDNEDPVAFTVRPAESAPVPWEYIFDAASLQVQSAAKRQLGVTLPDVRFRIITNPATDGIEGVHLGTLEGAIKKAKNLKEKYEERLAKKFAPPPEVKEV